LDDRLLRASPTATHAASSSGQEAVKTLRVIKQATCTGPASVRLSIGAKREERQRASEGQPTTQGPHSPRIAGSTSVLRPSPIRTVPSAPELHRILRISEGLVCLGRTAFRTARSEAFRSPLAGFTADRELGSSLPSPCPEGHIFSSEKYISRRRVGPQVACGWAGWAGRRCVA
jgi:hypothetical protein